ncbi:MAG: hypothetical protein ACI4UV_04830 [Victivallales bacterium]
MADIKEYPEHLRQAVDLIAAVLRRIREKTLEKSRNGCLYMAQAKGVTA